MLPKRYYVRPDGDDARDGTHPSRAWRTLERVGRGIFAPGDRVALQGGRRFPGPLRLGESHCGMTIRSYGAGRAIIEGGAGPGIDARNVAGLRLENLEVVGDGADGRNRSDGIRLWLEPDRPERQEGVQIARVEVHGFGEAGIAVGTAPRDDGRSGYRSIRIVAVDAHDNGDAGISVSGSYGPLLPGWAHTDVRVARCRAYRNRGIAGKGGHSGNGIVLSQVDGGVIERCDAFENGQNSDYDGGGPVGIWAWDSTRIVIQRCRSWKNRSMTRDGGGFDLDGGITHSVIRFNESRENAGAGYLVYQFAGARPAHDNRVHDNVSIDDGRTNLAGLFVGGGMGKTVFARNRVVVHASPAPGATPAAAGVDSQVNGEIEFRGNTFEVQDVPAVRVPERRSPIRFVGNRMTFEGDGPAVLWEGASYPSVDSWRAATGHD